MEYSQGKKKQKFQTLQALVKDVKSIVLCIKLLKTKRKPYMTKNKRKSGNNVNEESEIIERNQIEILELKRIIAVL